MYIYIEVYEAGYLVLHQYRECERGNWPIFEDTYHSWQEVINGGWFEKGWPIHISPDLFSNAGQDNTEWQTENLRGGK